MVQVGAVGTTGLKATRAGDGEVETLRVVLRTVLTPGGVKRDDLVTENVVARGDVLGDLYEPGACVGNEHIRRPGTRVRPVEVTDLVDLEKLERGLVNGLAVAVAVGQVVQNGPLVRVGPGDGPLDGDGVARVDRCVAACWSGVLVADDVARLIGIWGDKAVVSVGSRPAYHDRRIGFVRVAGRVVALPIDTIDDEVVDMTVGNGSACYSQTTQKGPSKNSHRGLSGQELNEPLFG